MQWECYNYIILSTNPNISAKSVEKTFSPIEIFFDTTLCEINAFFVGNFFDKLA